MSKHEKINLEEAIEKSPKQYKLALEYIYSILLPNEFVLFVSQAMRNKKEDWGRQGIFGYINDIRYYSTPSLIIVTNTRWIRKRAYIAPLPKSNNIPILFDDKEAKQNIFNSGKEYYRWVEPYDDIPAELPDAYKTGLTLQEWASSDIKFLLLKNITAGVMSYRFSNLNDIKKKYVRLVISSTDFTFEPEDGERLFSLLQLAVTNNGQIELGEVTKNEKSNQIHISGNVSGSTIILGNENEIQNSKKSE